MPLENASISSSFALSSFTSKYSAFLPKADLALSVCGQPAFPKIITLPAMIASSLVD